MAPAPRSRRLRRLRVALLLLVGFAPAVAVQAQNQGLVVRDSTLGALRGEVVPPGIDPELQPAHYLITPELGRQLGSDLFHSFETFGIGRGEVATFTGPDPISAPQSVENIISRVTGGSISQLDGTLRSTVPSADVYLLNPNGVLFGPDARLDVQGSFYVTNADYLRFGEERFEARGALGVPILAVDHPTAFGFLADNPSFDSPLPGIGIDRSQLEVPRGESISLIGGRLVDTTPKLVNVDLPADAGVDFFGLGPFGLPDPFRLRVVAGELVVGAEVEFSPSSDPVLVGVAAPTREGDLAFGLFDPDPVGVAGGHVRLEEFAPQYLPPGLILDLLVLGNPDPRSLLRAEAGRLNVTSVASEGEIEAGALRGEGRPSLTGFDALGDVRLVTTRLIANAGGSVVLRADEATLEGLVDPENGIALPAGVIPEVTASAPGMPAGVIDIDVGQLEIQNAGIFSINLGTGLGDDVIVHVDGAVAIRGVFPGFISGIHTETGGLGPAASIELEADTITLEDGGQIDSSSAFDLRPPELEALEGGGSIDVTARTAIRLLCDAACRKRFTDSGGALLPSGIFSSVIGNAGPGGQISVSAPLIELVGGAIAADSFTDDPRGDGGHVQVGGRSGAVRNLSIDDAGFISTSSFGAGDAGEIAVFVDGTLRVAGTDSEISSSAFGDIGEGNGGAVRIAADRVLLEDGGSLRATTEVASPGDPEQGAGGDIFVTARRVDLRSGSQISVASLGTRNAGNIAIQGAESVQLSEAAITAEAPEQEANGGNVEIEARLLVDLLRSEISANVGDGAGGSITIDPVFVVLDESRIVAQAGEGVGGAIRITSQQFLASPGSLVSASAGNPELSGSVVINSPDVEIAGTLSALPVTYADPAAQLRAGCEQRAREGGGSLVVEWRGGLPQEPDALLDAQARFDAAGS